jgi:hypothetical protein
LEWLRADLTDWTKLLVKGDYQSNYAQVRRTVRYWQIHPGFSSVRDADALTRFSAAERQAWQQLWSDIEALVRRLPIEVAIHEKKDK